MKRSGWLKSEVTIKVQVTETSNIGLQHQPITLKILPNQETAKVKIYNCPTSAQQTESTIVQVNLFIEGAYYPKLSKNILECIVEHKQPEIIGFVSSVNSTKRSCSYIDVPIINHRNYSILITLSGSRTGTLKANKDFIRIPIDTSIPKSDEIILTISKVKTEEVFNLGFTSSKIIIENDLTGPEIIIDSPTTCQSQRTFTVNARRKRCDNLSTAGWVKLKVQVRSLNSDLIERSSDSRSDQILLIKHGEVANTLEISMVQSDLGFSAETGFGGISSDVEIKVLSVESEFDNCTILGKIKNIEVVHDFKASAKVGFGKAIYRVKRSSGEVRIELNPKSGEYCVGYKIVKQKAESMMNLAGIGALKSRGGTGCV